MSRQAGAGVLEEVQPPHGEDEDQARRRRPGPAPASRRCLATHLHGDVAREDALAEHDDREQAVPLGDVVRMPRRRRARSAQTGTASSASDEHQERDGQPSGSNSRSTQPTWTSGDADRVPQRGRPVGARVAARRPQPLRDHRAAA